MDIRDLLWDDWNEEHIARHGITVGEVEAVCFGNHWNVRARGKDTRAYYGQTEAGRYLLVIVAHRGGGLYYPITARAMDESERRRYQQRKGR